MCFQICVGFILCFRFRCAAVGAISKSNDEVRFTTRRIINKVPVGVLLAKRKTRSMKTCQARYNSVPDDCWLLRACIQAEQRFSAGTCFSGHCNASEKVDNCPADCCPVKFPERCTLQDGVCPPKCCGDSTCCETSSGKGITALTVLMYIGIVISVIVLCVVGELLREKCCGGEENNIEVHASDDDDDDNDNDDTSSNSSKSDLFCLTCLCECLCE